MNQPTFDEIVSDVVGESKTMEFIDTISKFIFCKYNFIKSDWRESEDLANMQNELKEINLKQFSNVNIWKTFGFEPNISFLMVGNVKWTFPDDSTNTKYSNANNQENKKIKLLIQNYLESDNPLKYINSIIESHLKTKLKLDYIRPHHSIDLSPYCCNSECDKCFKLFDKYEDIYKANQHSVCTQHCHILNRNKSNGQLDINNYNLYNVKRKFVPRSTPAIIFGVLDKVITFKDDTFYKLGGRVAVHLLMTPGVLTRNLYPDMKCLVFEEDGKVIYEDLKS